MPRKPSFRRDTLDRARLHSTVPRHARRRGGARGRAGRAAVRVCSARSLPAPACPGCLGPDRARSRTRATSSTGASQDGAVEETFNAPHIGALQATMRTVATFGAARTRLKTTWITR